MAISYMIDTEKSQMYYHRKAVCGHINFVILVVEYNRHSVNSSARCFLLLLILIVDFFFSRNSRYLPELMVIDSVNSEYLLYRISLENAYKLSIYIGSN